MAAQIKKSAALAPKNAAAAKVLADQKTETAAPAAEVVKARSEDLMTLAVPAKETDQTLIVPKTVNGKERWFAKSVIKSFEKSDDKFVITATRREFAYRGLEEQAQLVAH